LAIQSLLIRAVYEVGKLKKK